MPIKKPYTIKALTAQDVPHIDENFNLLYKNKLECRFKYEGSSTAVAYYINNFTELGQISVSANGSPTIVKSIPLQERSERVLFAEAHAISPLVSAHVTDITGTSITIEARTISGTANFSAVTTASIIVFFQYIGSNPGN